MSHWGLSIIRVNHFLKGTLNEDEATVPTASEHYTAVHTGVSFPDFLPFPRIVHGICEFEPFFSYLPGFDTLNGYARYEPGGEKDTQTRFY